MAKIKDFKPVFVEENGEMKIYWTKKDKAENESFKKKASKRGEHIV